MPDMESMKLADLYQWGAVRSLALSADGRWAAALWTGFLKEADERYESIFVVPTDGSAPAHRLSRSAAHESHLALSQDGRFLFSLARRKDELEVAEAKAAATKALSDRDKADQAADSPADEDPKAQIWAYDLKSGGEPRQLTSWEDGVNDFSLSPDGSRLVFSARAPSATERAYLKALKKDGAPFVLTRTQHKQDGDGFSDTVQSHLFVLDVASRAITPLTAGPATEYAPVWSRSGDEIAFLSNRTGDPDNNRRTDAWLIRPDGTDIRRLTLGDVEVRALAFSPDSSQVALVVSLQPENSYCLSHIGLVAVQDAQPVADFDRLGAGFSTVGGVVPDSGGVNPIASARVYPDPIGRTPITILTMSLDRPIESAPHYGEHGEIWALAGDRGQTRLVVIKDGQAALAFPQDRMASISSFAHATDTSVAIVTSGFGGPELHRIEGAAESTLLWAPLAPLLKTRRLGDARRFSFAATDGPEVEGFALFPPGYDAALGPLPTVVMIHGGPMAYDEPGLEFDEQLVLAHGYLVLKVNYRGSTSYGEAFCLSIQSDWGPREHADLMACVDSAIDRGWADPARLFVTGFSQGGIITNWAVGHSDRFKAAVSEHGMWDYVAAFGTDDCHLWWQDDLGVPWQNEAAYRRLSPASSAAQIHTPLLITAGEHDWRCPLDQAELLYMTLKKRGVPTALIVYQDEHHSISKPKRAIDRVLRILRWFAAYGGQPVTDDSAPGFPDPS